jgi:transcriptional regulator with XRE-family HTH domain
MTGKAAKEKFMNFSLSSTRTSRDSFQRTWKRLAKSKRFREQYIAGFVKRSIPAQIRGLMNKGRLTQQELADRAGLTQGVISRAADLKYGDLTLNTIIRIAAGFDCAFIGKFVPFTEFLRELDRQSEPFIAIPSFEAENERIAQGEHESQSKSLNTKGIGGAGKVKNIDENIFGSTQFPSPQGQGQGKGMEMLI